MKGLELLNQILATVLANHELFAPIELTPSAITSQMALASALDYLGPNHPIFLHLLERYSGLVDVSGTVGMHKLLMPSNLIEMSRSLSINSIPDNAGVYVFQHLSGQQYVGSAIDFSTRLKEHMTGLTTSRRQLHMHRYALANGGLESLKWGVLYSLPNFVDSFVLAYPQFEISKGHYELLIGITQWLPRILEQSLMNNFPHTLNGGQNPVVTFRYVRWARLDFANFDPNAFGVALVEVRDAVTGALLKGNIISKTFAATFIGVGATSIRRHIGSTKGLWSPKLQLQVTINYLGSALSRSAPLTWDRSIKLPALTLASLSLTDLEPRWLYAFMPNKIDFVGPFYSIGEASAMLNPTRVQGLDKPRVQRRSKDIQLYVNYERLVNTEKGSFYFARHLHYKGFTYKNRAARPAGGKFPV